MELFFKICIKKIFMLMFNIKSDLLALNTLSAIFENPQFFMTLQIVCIFYNTQSKIHFMLPLEFYMFIFYTK